MKIYATLLILACSINYSFSQQRMQQPSLIQYALNDSLVRSYVSNFSKSEFPDTLSVEYNGEKYSFIHDGTTSWMTKSQGGDHTKVVFTTINIEDSKGKVDMEFVYDSALDISMHLTKKADGTSYFTSKVKAKGERGDKKYSAVYVSTE